MDVIRSILVPTDFSPLADVAAERAASLARPDRAAVHLVHAISPLLVDPYGVGVPTAIWNEIRSAARGKLDETRRRVEASGVQSVTVDLFESSDVLAAIGESVDKHRPDLIVMGTHGRGAFQRALLGSVVDRALRTLDRPILAVKGDPVGAAGPIDRILLAVDFSSHSDRAVAAAAHFATRLGASVEVLHAFWLPPDYSPYASSAAVEFEQKLQLEAFEQLAAVRTQLAAQEIPVQVHLRRGRPHTVIADAAQELGCELIVMGTSGRTGLAHVLLGSVAERTLRSAHCSVLCVKASATLADAPPALHERS
jgi:nucleotide-binding universal stress UspA family protein